MSLLEIKNLHANVDDHEILKGINLTVNRGRSALDHGPERLGQEHAGAGAGAARERTTSPRARSLFNGKDLLEMKPEEAACEGVFPGLPVSGRDSRHQQCLLSALGAERDPQVSRPGRNGRDGLSAAAPREAEAAGDGREADEPLGERRLLRRREEAQRDFADGGAGAEAGDSG